MPDKEKIKDKDGNGIPDATDANRRFWVGLLLIVFGIVGFFVGDMEISGVNTAIIFGSALIMEEKIASVISAKR